MPTPDEPFDRAAAPDERRTRALIAGVAATVGFVALRVIVALNGHAPLPIDVWWSDLMIAVRTDVGVFLAWIPAIVGGTVGMIVIGALLVLALVWRRRRWDAATLAVAMVIVVSIGAPLAALIARTRPSDSLAERMATSFPSGHTAVATTVVVVLALALRRWYVWVAGAAWVILMMWSRTYLHAHWFTDVTAGLLEGIAVAALVWSAVEALRDRRARRAASTADEHLTPQETARP